MECNRYHKWHLLLYRHMQLVEVWLFFTKPLMFFNKRLSDILLALFLFFIFFHLKTLRTSSSSWRLCKHLLSCLLEIRPSFIVKLFFCVIGSSLSLCVLKWRVVGCRGLLHTHHRASSLHVWNAGISILSSHPCVHP